MSTISQSERLGRTPLKKIAKKPRKTPKHRGHRRAFDAHVAKLAANATRLLSTSLLLALARIAGAGAGFVTQIVLARNLAASALGKVS